MGARLRQRTYETKSGEKRTVYEVEADDVAASLKFASAKVNRASRSSASSGGGFGGGQGAGHGSSGGSREPDPWAADAHGYSDEPPF